MTSSIEKRFKQDYDRHLKHLKLKGYQPKTVEAYARAMRRIRGYFNDQIYDLSQTQ